LQGDRGPQGIQGPQGLPGIISIMGLNLPLNSNFLTALPHNIDQINDLGTAANKLVYTNGVNVGYDIDSSFTWESASLTVFSKELEMNNDASFCIIAAKEGIYISTDKGISWDSYDPGTEEYIRASCAGTGGRAVALGDTSQAVGTIWVTSNYGVDWTEKTVSE